MIESTVITIKGMSCRHCNETIRAKLMEIDGANSVSVSLEDASVAVIYDVEKVSREALVRAITDLGYEAH